MPFWDGDEWHLWIPHNAGLIATNPIDAVLTDYVAQMAANKSDLFIPFVNTMWQKACWPDTYSIIKAICDDFHCLGASIAKLKYIHKSQHDLESGICSIFAATEVEYICIVARSIFDLLQEVISTIWNSKVTLLDPETQRKKNARKLPTSFAKIILKDKRTLKTSKEISTEYHLPGSIADQYVLQGQFFQVLRDYRDSIVHGFSRTPTIHTTERGFCIDPTHKPFDRVAGWEPHQRYNEHLVSLLPVLNQIIATSIDSCNCIMAAFEKHIKFPPEIAPGYKVFVRGLCNDALLEVQNNVSWWD